MSARADEINVTWNGTRVITKIDDQFTRGRIGVWTRADSVTAFDNLEATAR